MTTSRRVPVVRRGDWRGEPAITLLAGSYSATFLPECGMLGVALTHRDDELLALPRSLADYRVGMPTGGYTGLPINAPYANRLSRRRFDVDGRQARIARNAPCDRLGLPIHGHVHAQPFEIVSIGRTQTTARVVARFRHRSKPMLRAFPFAHELTIAVELSRRGLRIETTVATDEPGPIPVSFGWHPFLRVPNEDRSRWQLRLPPRHHVALDERLIPTGATRRYGTHGAPLGRRTFDDHFALGTDRSFSLVGGDRVIDIEFDAGYPFAQIYLPPRDAEGWLTTDFICIEPMTAPIDALVTGRAPSASADAPFRAAFTIAAHSRPGSLRKP